MSEGDSSGETSEGDSSSEMSEGGGAATAPVDAEGERPTVPMDLEAIETEETVTSADTASSKKASSNVDIHFSSDSELEGGSADESEDSSGGIEDGSADESDNSSGGRTLPCGCARGTVAGYNTEDKFFCQAFDDAVTKLEQLNTGRGLKSEEKRKVDEVGCLIVEHMRLDPDSDLDNDACVDLADRCQPVFAAFGRGIDKKANSGEKITSYITKTHFGFKKKGGRLGFVKSALQIGRSVV